MVQTGKNQSQRSGARSISTGGWLKLVAIALLATFGPSSVLAGLDLGKPTNYYVQECKDSSAQSTPLTPAIQQVVSDVETVVGGNETPESQAQAKLIRDLIGPSNYKELLSSIRDRARRSGFDVSKLTEPELVAIAYYTASGYQSLNAALRSGDLGKFKPIADALNSALSKLPSYSGTVYRGCMLTSELCEIHQPGAVIQYSGFTSTASEKGRAWDGAQFEIRGKRGVNIDLISSWPGEREVLFPSGSFFRVLEMDKVKNRIVMEEIEPTAAQLATLTTDTQTYLAARRKDKGQESNQPISIPTPEPSPGNMGEGLSSQALEKLFEKKDKQLDKLLDNLDQYEAFKKTPGGTEKYQKYLKQLQKLEEAQELGDGFKKYDKSLPKTFGNGAPSKGQP
jgi:hypothetical protein